MLNYRKLGSGKPLFILHGVFGSSDNWQTVGKELAKQFTVFLIDQRNHGKSFHSDEFTFSAMSDDLMQIVHHEKIEQLYLLGHSMGGKTSMFFSSEHKNLVEKLIVVDIAPKKYPPHHQDIFKAFKSVNLDVIKSRKEAEISLAPIIRDFGVRQFIMKSLERNSSGAFSWKNNINGIEKNINNILNGFYSDMNYKGETLFIKGGRSDYIQLSDIPLIDHHFPNNHVITIENAGHWVHAEKPTELTDIVLNFLS